MSVFAGADVMGLACDWWYVEVQLFWKIGGGELALPCSCAEVELYPQAVA